MHKNWLFQSKEILYGRRPSIKVLDRDPDCSFDKIIVREIL